MANVCQATVQQLLLSSHWFKRKALKNKRDDFQSSFYDNRTNSRALIG